MKTYLDFFLLTLAMRRELGIRGTIALHLGHNILYVWDKAPGIMGIVPPYCNDNHILGR